MAPTGGVVIHSLTHIKSVVLHACLSVVCLTLAGGEGGAPGVAPQTHHQGVSHQPVAFVTEELHGAP